MAEEKSKGKLINIGGLWAKKTKDGKTFLSGKTTMALKPGTPVFIFKNSYKKEGDNRPDYDLSISMPLEETQPSAKGSIMDSFGKQDDLL